MTRSKPAAKKPARTARTANAKPKPKAQAATKPKLSRHEDFEAFKLWFETAYRETPMMPREWAAHVAGVGRSAIANRIKRKSITFKRYTFRDGHTVELVSVVDVRHIRPHGAYWSNTTH